MKKRWITVLDLKALTEVERIRKAQEIKNAMEKNAALFPDPDPALAELQGQIDTTQTAYDDSRDAGTKATAEYQTKLDDLERMLNSQANYVENVANEDPDNGKEIIRAAAMEFKDVGERNVPDFEAENGDTRGDVDASMKSQGPGTAYVWEEKEEGTDTWVYAGTTSVSSFTYTGLKSVTRYELRGGWVKGKGKVEYFDPVSITVD